ncbi:MAG: c-type cytochrome biogenesis protein CcsB [Clostridia bacterium]|nr:c-type cytochrome biogenesis protein CcsB [Clostridia bacterium]
MESLQTPLMLVTLLCYVSAFGLLIYVFYSPREKVRKIARGINLLGFGLTTLLLGIRTVLIAGLPLTNTYEFGLCFAWAISLIFIIIDYRHNLTAAGLFVLPLIIGLMAWLINLDNSVRPLMPALRSPWLVIHVLTAVIAYGAFALSFVLAIMYLLKEKQNSMGTESKWARALPSLDLLDDLSYKLVFVGLPFLTIMLVTGAVWAEYSWGSYWSWDPKETWALITWFIYSVYLHVRFMVGWKGKKAAYLSILGFGAVMFTFIGVTYLLPGLHSYV